MADCNACKEIRRELKPIPQESHDKDMARAHRTMHCIIAALIAVVILWFATIGMFVWYLNQYDFESYEYAQDGEGINIIGDRNGVDYNGPDVKNS